MATRSGADDAVPDCEDCRAETVDAEKAASPLVRKRIAQKVWRMVAPQMRRHTTIAARGVSSRRNGFPRFAGRFGAAEGPLVDWFLWERFRDVFWLCNGGESLDVEAL